MFCKWKRSWTSTIRIGLLQNTIQVVFGCFSEWYRLLTMPICYITKTKWEWYLLKKSNSNGTCSTSFLFAEHPRWMYWAHNMTERKRCSDQRSLYLQRSPGDANMTEDDLREIIKEIRTRLKELLGRKQAYNGNINGVAIELWFRNVFCCFLCACESEWWMMSDEFFCMVSVVSFAICSSMKERQSCKLWKNRWNVNAMYKYRNNYFVKIFNRYV